MAFTTEDEARDAVVNVAANYRKHAAAARELAAGYFDSTRVLSTLVEEAMK